MCAREPGTSVILARKRDSRRHSTTIFFENVAVVFLKLFHFVIRRGLNLLQKLFPCVLFYGEKEN